MTEDQNGAGALEENESFTFAPNVDDETVVEGDETVDENNNEVGVNNTATVIRDGDVFVFDNGVIALIVLSVSDMTSVGRIYKVRLASVVSKPVDVSASELIDYINVNGLTKLNSFTDQIESLRGVLLLEQGDVLTRNGEFFMEILSNEVMYVDTIGDTKSIIGVRMNDGSVSYRDALWVKGQVYGNTDQFQVNN